MLAITEGGCILMKSANLFNRIVYALILIVFTCCPASAAVLTYQYDTLNRLTRVERSDGSVTVYEYDELGNRKRMVVTNNTSVPRAIFLAHPRAGTSLLPCILPISQQEA